MHPSDRRKIPCVLGYFLYRLFIRLGVPRATRLFGRVRCVLTPDRGVRVSRVQLYWVGLRLLDYICSISMEMVILLLSASACARKLQTEVERTGPRTALPLGSCELTRAVHQTRTQRHDESNRNTTVPAPRCRRARLRVCVSCHCCLSLSVSGPGCACGCALWVWRAAARDDVRWLVRSAVSRVGRFYF